MTTTVLRILRKAGDEIELLTGNKIVAFLVDKVDPEKDKATSVNKLRTAICQMFDVSWNDINKKCRKTNLVLARHLFYWYATDRIGISLTEVANMFGKDHTTVIHGRDKIRDFISINDKLVLEQIQTLQMYLDFKPEEV